MFDSKNMLIEIGGCRGCGKTVQLLKLAAENGWIVVSPCSDAHKETAKCLGLDNLEIIDYANFLHKATVGVNKKLAVDELDFLLDYIGENKSLYNELTNKIIACTYYDECKDIVRLFAQHRKNRN